MLSKNGIPTAEDLKKVMPAEERLARGAVSITECFQNIPCNPCVTSCPQKAITMPDGINDLPRVDHELCNGCGICVSRCPGLAIFIVDKSASGDTAVVRLPFEFLPLPQAGQYVRGLDRSGEERGWFKVVRVTSGGAKNKTYTISLEVPKELCMEIRNIGIGGYRDEQ